MMFWKVNTNASAKRAVCSCGWKSEHRAVPLDTFPPDVMAEVKAHEASHDPLAIIDAAYRDMTTDLGRDVLNEMRRAVEDARATPPS